MIYCWVSNRKNCMYALINGVVVVETGCMHRHSLLSYFYELLVMVSSSSRSRDSSITKLFWA